MTDRDINETHDAGRVSWVASANAPGGDFPIQNLPFGVFKTPAHETPRVGVRVGDQILDLFAAAAAELLQAAGDATKKACCAARLNELMTLAPAARSALRAALSEMLTDGHAARERAERCLVSADRVEMLLPAAIGDYTDFYAALQHATNVGSMFRPDNPLLPNYKHVPIGYHGRSSSIVVSGSPITRPAGQTKAEDAENPTFGLTKRLDYELEVGLFVGPGNSLGSPIAIERAEEHIFGLCLVNDWSARDVQTWEYQPLGPFLAKNFATTISPWVVTQEALAPFRAPAYARPSGDPRPLPYLASARDEARGGFDLTLEVSLSTKLMREQKLPPAQLSRGSFREMYWTLAQLITHHTSGGCNLRPGDLLASGTVSGAAKDSRGCLLELTWRGSEPIVLPGGEARRFLEDGDEVIMRGYAEREGFRRVGFGECRGLVTGPSPEGQR